MFRRLLATKAQAACPVYEGHALIVVGAEETYVEPQRAGERLRKGLASLVLAQHWIDHLLGCEAFRLCPRDITSTAARILSILEEPRAYWNVHRVKMRPVNLLLDCFGAVFHAFNQVQIYIKCLSEKSIVKAREEATSRALQQLSHILQLALRELLKVVEGIRMRKSLVTPPDSCRSSFDGLSLQESQHASRTISNVDFEWEERTGTNSIGGPSSETSMSSDSAGLPSDSKGFVTFEDRHLQKSLVRETAGDEDLDWANGKVAMSDLYLIKTLHLSEIEHVEHVNKVEALGVQEPRCQDEFLQLGDGGHLRASSEHTSQTWPRTVQEQERSNDTWLSHTATRPVPINQVSPLTTMQTGPESMVLPTDSSQSFPDQSQILRATRSTLSARPFIRPTILQKRRSLHSPRSIDTRQTSSFTDQREETEDREPACGLPSMSALSTRQSLTETLAISTLREEMKALATTKHAPLCLDKSMRYTLADLTQLQKHFSKQFEEVRIKATKAQMKQHTHLTTQIMHDGRHWRFCT